MDSKTFSDNVEPTGELVFVEIEGWDLRGGNQIHLYISVKKYGKEYYDGEKEMAKQIEVKHWTGLIQYWNSG